MNSLEADVLETGKMGLCEDLSNSTGAELL